MINPEPLLSVVVVSRNDDHGGNLMHRMQLFVTGWIEQAKRHNLRSELVIVEWNPLPDRPRLAEALKWPKDTGPCAVRIVEVPPEIHRRFKYSDSLSVFQMIGKNAGIRRARGRFILATNIDILFSDEIMEFFASGQMAAGHMYRVDRYDVPSEIPDGVPIEEQLAYCRQNIIRINAKEGTKILVRDAAPNPVRERLAHLYRRIIRLASVRNRLVDWTLPGKSLHTNACGDFTLMAREHWLAVRGYPEFEMYSFYLDGLGCYAANYAGAEETILEEPMRIYHIEHAAGSGWSPGAGGNLLKERLSAAGIPQLSSSEYVALVRQMRRKRRPIIFNGDEGWGLAGESLIETIITKELYK
ncbi:MAG: hypothetical protein A2Y90_02145 [Chloroflexi bacterium RBG_13_52_12]|nr:MAG: hypothetical protein A2Y90_02145 [Chloroflexi bacterium RBG_13_52_12]